MKTSAQLVPPKQLPERLLALLQEESRTVMQLVKLTGFADSTIRDKLANLHTEGKVTRREESPGNVIWSATGIISSGGRDYLVAALFGYGPARKEAA